MNEKDEFWREKTIEKIWGYFWYGVLIFVILWFIVGLINFSN